MARIYKNILPVAFAIVMGIMTLACARKDTKEKESDSIVKIEEAIASMAKDGIPTVVDFYADWCGPCKQIAPLFHELEEKYSEKINFLRVNIDEQPELKDEYNIEAVPTFVFLDEDGKEISRIVGANATELTEVVEAVAAGENINSKN